MSNINLIKEWIQYLKSHGIVSTNSDPNTGKLVYKRRVFTDDIVSFLDNLCDLGSVTAEEIVNKVIGSVASNNSTESQSDEFINDRGIEITEIDIKKILEYAKSLQQQRADEEAAQDEADKKKAEQKENARRNKAISEIKETISEHMSKVQRRIFVNHIAAIRNKQTIIPLARIVNALTFLVRKSRKRAGISGMFPLKNKGPTFEALQSSWRATGLPIDEIGFLAFLAEQGFDKQMVHDAFHESAIPDKYDGEDEIYSSDLPLSFKQYKLSIKFAKGTVERFTETEVSEIAQYAESIT